MRLNTILDAALLAEAEGVDFGFLWDESATPAVDQQTTSRARAVFAADFLARHRLDRVADAAPVLLPPPRSEAEWQARLAAARQAGVLVLDQPRDWKYFRPAMNVAAERYLQIFDKLGFALGARAGIEAARAVDLAPDAVGIHLRGGDILHGTHANMLNYLHKAPSIPEIATLIESLGDVPIWLVGQEPDVQQALSRAYPQVRAFGVTDPVPSLDPVGQVLFDAVLMGRMVAIHGGNSGVTLLSRRLGGVAFTDISRDRSLVDVKSLLSDPMADQRWQDVSANARAHAYVKTLAGLSPQQWGPDQLALIRLARRHRAGSAFLPLIEVCALAALGRGDEAEAIARNWLATPPPREEPKVSFAFLLGGADYFPVEPALRIEPLVASDRPALALILALARFMAAPDAATEKRVRKAIAATDGISPAFVRMVQAGLAMPSEVTP